MAISSAAHLENVAQHILTSKQRDTLERMCALIKKQQIIKAAGEIYCMFENNQV